MWDWNTPQGKRKGSTVANISILKKNWNTPQGKRKAVRLCCFYSCVGIEIHHRGKGSSERGVSKSTVNHDWNTPQGKRKSFSWSDSICFLIDWNTPQGKRKRSKRIFLSDSTMIEIHHRGKGRWLSGYNRWLRRRLKYTTGEKEVATVFWTVLLQMRLKYTTGEKEAMLWILTLLVRFNWNTPQGKRKQIKIWFMLFCQEDWNTPQGKRKQVCAKRAEVMA